MTLPRVLVLMGGPSAEREVSLVSGEAVALALEGAGYPVLRGDISPDDLSLLDGDFDMVFPVLHGPFGEDGQLQEILEERGLKYVGSDATASRLAMDKYLAKKVFERSGLTVPPGELVDEGASRHDIEAILGRLAGPWVIKPNCQGSSIGITITGDVGVACGAIEAAVKDYGPSLVETCIKGREFTVGVLGCAPLPLVEIVPAEGFYDYKAKYLADSTRYEFDIDLPCELIGKMSQAGLDAFNALGCRHLGRIDLILDGAGRIYVLEVNTLPGFTDHSLVPKAAGRAGMSMGQICSAIVLMALDRPI